jgi:DNA gyrase subunit A
MRLQRLTGLEREKIKLDYEELQKLIAYLKRLLADEGLRMQVIKDELSDLIARYGDERRTSIIPDAGEFNPEDFYADDDMIITVSHLGYIKRTPLTEFRRITRQYRPKETRDEDYPEHLNANMHNTMPQKGRCLDEGRHPEGQRHRRSRPYRI